MLSFVAEVISTLADSLGIMDRVKKFIGHYEPASPIHQVADRIFQVFETHGVNRANIVGFVNPKHGITFADLISHDAFIPKITNELLDKISKSSISILNGSPEILMKYIQASFLVQPCPVIHTPRSQASRRNAYRASVQLWPPH